MHKSRIPLARPSITSQELRNVIKVLKSGYLSSGKTVKEFEREFADYIGVKFAVAVNSCASALQIAILASDLKGEIILPSFTFVASANAIINSGCTPVFGEVDSDTRNIDPRSIEEKITKNTVAIMPVHFGGLSCRMDKITAIAKKHNLMVIEDSAEAIGAQYKSRNTGSWGIGCFSFFPSKNITTGEGGMITSNDEHFIERARILISHGISRDSSSRAYPWYRNAVCAGFNYRMTDIQASLGLAQLSRLDELNEKRRRNAFYLNSLLKGIDCIGLPMEPKGYRHVYQMYTIRLDSRRICRDKLVLYLRDQFIEASAHFVPPVHLCSFFKKSSYGKDSLPVTEKLSSAIITLPMYPQLSKSDLRRIASALKRGLKYVCKS